MHHRILFSYKENEMKLAGKWIQLENTALSEVKCVKKQGRVLEMGTGGGKCYKESRGDKQRQGEVTPRMLAKATGEKHCIR